MNVKNRITRAIKGDDLDRTTLMYRGKSSTNSKLLKHFLDIDPGETDRIYNAYYNDKSLSIHHKDLLEEVGADIFSGGYTVSDFFTYFPFYKGPGINLNHDHLYWYTWGIDNQVVKISGLKKINPKDKRST